MPLPRRFLQLALAFAVTVSLPTARAWNPKDLAIQSFKEAENAGITHIGPSDLSSLLKRLKKSQWRVVPGFPSGSGDRNRMSGVNLVEENLVVLSAHTLEKLTEDGLRTLLIHEALGSAGVDDEDYSVSLSLALFTAKTRLPLLSRSGVESHLRRIIANAKTFRRNREYLIAGGATIVGGGGDGIATSLKYTLLQVWGHQVRNPLAYTKNVLALDIWVNYLPEFQRSVRVDNTRRGGRTTIHYLNWLTGEQFIGSALATLHAYLEPRS